MPEQISELNPAQRVLMGPGPSSVHPRVYRALSTPIIGHLDPDFLAIMDEIKHQLRYVFQTQNAFTIAISGTGSAGMEAAFVNTIEPGDKVIVGLNGVFGGRMTELVRRCGAEAITLEAPWGEVIEIDRIEAELKKQQVKAVALVHAETSTGALQPLDHIGELCKQHGALFIVDAVTSLAGLPVNVDERQIDVCYSGTQKCLSCPPGLAPLTLSQTAIEVIHNRKTPVQSWYLDVSLLSKYWEPGQRAYHHTAPISMNYALYEALRLIREEGLEARYQRHQHNHELLITGLQELGLAPYVKADIRLPVLNSVTIPKDADDQAVRQRLLHEFNIEIGAGLGSLSGRVWRIGLMGESSNKANIVYLLAALREILN